MTGFQLHQIKAFSEALYRLYSLPAAQNLPDVLPSIVAEFMDSAFITLGQISSSHEATVTRLDCIILPLPFDRHTLEITRPGGFDMAERVLVELFGAHIAQCHQRAQKARLCLVPAKKAGASGSVEVKLTPRELEIAEWLASGKSNSEIGIILGISTRTVAKHVERIYAKFDVDTRTAAAAKARAFLGGKAARNPDRLARP